MNIRSYLVSKKSNRNGVAAVEAALMLPLLVIVTFGAIDVAQYINLGQVVCNASREGARVASQSHIVSVSEVEAAIVDYLASSNPHLSDSELNSAIDVKIRKQSASLSDVATFESAIDNGNLAAIDSGDPISIQVDFDFSTIRWLNGIPLSNPTTTTICRRE